METATNGKAAESLRQRMKKDPTPYMVMGAGLVLGLATDLLALTGEVGWDLINAMLICSTILMVGSIIWLDVIWRLDALSREAPA